MGGRGPEDAALEPFVPPPFSLFDVKAPRGDLWVFLFPGLDIDQVKLASRTTVRLLSSMTITQLEKKG